MGTPMLYHHSYYGVSPLPLPNVISFTTTISTTSASLYHSCILDHCFFGLPLYFWITAVSTYQTKQSVTPISAFSSIYQTEACLELPTLTAHTHTYRHTHTHT